MNLGLRPLSAAGEQMLNELESDYGVGRVRVGDASPDGERIYAINDEGVARHYERHLTGYDAEWATHLVLTIY